MGFMKRLNPDNPAYKGCHIYTAEDGTITYYVKRKGNLEAANFANCIINGNRENELIFLGQILTQETLFLAFHSKY